MVSADVRARFFEALDRENGSISGAARAVGVNRATAFGWAREAGVRGRGTAGKGRHPGRVEYDQLRAAGVRRRDAAQQVGVNERTARDWDHGVRKSAHARVYANGRRIDYKTGVTTLVSGAAASSVAAVEAVLDPRFLTVVERELIADLRREGQSLRAIGRALGRPASTVKREIDARSVDGVYRPHRAERAWEGSPAVRGLRWRWSLMPPSPGTLPAPQTNSRPAAHDVARPFVRPEGSGRPLAARPRQRAGCKNQPRVIFTF